MEMHQILFVIFFISSPSTVSAWEFAVAVENKIQFLNTTGDVIANVSESMVDLQALTYSPEQQLLFFSDNKLKNGSIFSFQIPTDSTKTVTYSDLRAVVSEQNHNVQNIAYDHRGQILYWTNGFGGEIKWLKLGSNTTPQPGWTLFHFKDKLPFGIAIDSCKRYVYWTNCKNFEATIERSLLTGSKHEVLINKGLDNPLGIVLDQSSQRMFWIDDLIGNTYKIESATFTGQDRRVLIDGYDHRPFSLAISGGHVYWTDSANTAVWKLPIDANSKVKPIRVIDMKLDKKIVPTITSAGQILSNDLLECDDVVEPIMKRINATIEKIIPANIEEITKLKESKNCDFPLPNSGSRCENDVCHNYCLKGACDTDSAGQPRCTKCEEGWAGDRCQTNICHNYCVRGNCIVENSVQPKCICNEDWVGDRCEIWQQKLEQDMSEACQNYCKHYTNSEQQSRPLQNCRCSDDKTVSANDSESRGVVSEMRNQSCMWNEVNQVIVLTLGFFCLALLILVAILTRKVFTLRKRPRIKKRIIVSKSVTPLTSRPQPEQCEITIENCCNMNICETPCFEPEFRTPCATLTKNGKKEEKKSLLGSIELPPDDLY